MTDGTPEATATERTETSQTQTPALRDEDSAHPEETRRVGLVEITAPAASRDIRDATLIKEGDLFLLTNLEGNVPRGNPNGFGLYYQDTRFLSAYELAIQGLRPTTLLSTGRFHFVGAQVLTNPALLTAEGQRVSEQTIQIRRYRIVRRTDASESLTIQNFNTFPITLDVAFHFEADFADMFEVRGLVRSETRGTLHEPQYQGNDTIVFRYDGRDGIVRTTTVRFDPPPAGLRAGTASYRLELPPGGSHRLTISIQIALVHQTPEARSIPSIPTRAPLTGYRQWLAEQVSLETSNGLFNAIFLQARYDLRVLLSGDVEMPYIAAGIPWYATLFGRDSLVTALQDLWISPSSARHVLRLLARFQGTRDDPWRDEEPGKIMHELRRGELANLGEIPFTPYYGSIDATPLWIILLGEYYRATGDLALVQELRPHLDAALQWIDRYGDRDGDGFVEYHCRSESGLVNQGWKDSWDGIVHADGSLPEPPIALVEVQGNVYAARRLAAEMFRALGDHERAHQIDEQANALRKAFDTAFWMPSENYYCVALDAHKQQVTSITSNPGQALWSGIVPPERAEAVARRLMDEDMFSGWGIRTLSSREIRYNPTGYHVGTVWPHDNALIALGLKRYHQEALAVELITGLYEAVQHFPSYRMPELFCGFARSAFGVPVRYPVACSPQAWAASAWSAMLQALLGIQLNAPAGELRIVRPSLPPWLQWVHVKRLAVGEGEVDLRYERIGDHTAVDVAAMRGDVRVTFVKNWDE